MSVTAQLMIVLLPAAEGKAHSGPHRVFRVGAQKEDVRAQVAQPRAVHQAEAQRPDLALPRASRYS